jgi:hypothetical protein
MVLELLDQGGAELLGPGRLPAGQLELVDLYGGLTVGPRTIEPRNHEARLGLHDSRHSSAGATVRC